MSRMNKDQFMVNALREYAEQSNTIVRSTSDLSPLEEWLLLKYYHADRNYEATVSYLNIIIKEHNEKSD